MTGRRLIPVFTLLAAIGGSGNARGQTYGKAPTPGEKGPDAPANVDYEQKLGATVPLDLELFDHDGKAVKLGDAIGGKPTVFVLHYNRCPKLCNEVISGLIDALNDARRTDPAFVAGGPFNVVLVSVDPREAPPAVRKNRELFHQQYDRRSSDTPGVWFLTASHGQGTDVADADRKIHRLAEAVGFKYSLRFRNKDYEYTPEGGWKTADGRLTLPAEPRSYDYAHAPGLVFLTPAGTVSKYLLRLNPPARDFRLAVVDASGGKVGTLSDKIAQYCFVYDDIKGHYRFTMKWVAVAFTPVYLLAIYLVYRTVRQMRSEVPLAPPAPEPATPTGV